MHERNANRIAVVGAGDMGSSVAADLRENGFDVTTCFRRRSQRSRQIVLLIPETASKTLYVECNAVAPSTVREIAEIASTYKAAGQRVRESMARITKNRAAIHSTGPTGT